MTETVKAAYIEIAVRVPADLSHDENVAAHIALAAQEYANEMYGRADDDEEEL